MAGDKVQLPNASSDFGRQLAAVFASAMFMHVDENLRLTSYNAAAAVRLEARYRFIDVDGNVMPSVEAQVPATNRSATTSIFLTPTGWLLGGEVFVSGASPSLGQTFVVVEIVRGTGANAIALQTIAAGYVTAKQPLAFPTSTVINSLDTGGALRSITGTQPAAGAELLETVPTGARWQLLALRVLLTTNATAGNRQLLLYVDDGTTRLPSFPSVGVVAPSTAGGFEFAAGSTAIANIAGQNPPGLIPTGIYLGAGYRIRSTTVSLAAGDQYGAPQYLVREWLEGA